MAEIYNQADIYWMSPDVDCMPGSLLEAFAAGLPVISTNAGGVPYMVRDEETGLLVNRNDHEAMARAAFRLLDDEALARRISANARGELTKYRGEVVAHQWIELYRRVSAGS
jgi:glycosyltransferase involved in cell wall biosynthesis